MPPNAPTVRHTRTFSQYPFQQLSDGAWQAPLHKRAQTNQTKTRSLAVHLEFREKDQVVVFYEKAGTPLDRPDCQCVVSTSSYLPPHPHFGSRGASAVIRRGGRDSEHSHTTRCTDYAHFMPVLQAPWPSRGDVSSAETVPTALRSPE